MKNFQQGMNQSANPQNPVQKQKTPFLKNNGGDSRKAGKAPILNNIWKMSFSFSSNIYVSEYAFDIFIMLC